MMTKPNNSAAFAPSGDPEDAQKDGVPPARIGVASRAHANDDASSGPLGMRAATLAAANDDHVASAAIAVSVYSPYGPQAAANDDGTDPEPPLPGRYAQVPPADWCGDDPHVQRLVAELSAIASDGSRPRGERIVAASLLEVARGTGHLQSIAGRMAILAFTRRFRLPKTMLRVGSPGREVLGRFASRFLLEDTDATVDTRSGAFFRERRPSVLALGRRLFDRCIADGTPVPSNGKGSFSEEWVSAETGADIAKVRWNVGLSRIFAEQLASGQLALGPVFVPSRPMTDVERRRRLAELKAVYDGFDVEGGKVPESPLMRGRVDWDYCTALAGPGPSLADDRELRKYVAAIVARRGTMLPGLMVRLPNLAALREYGLALVAKEAEGKSSAAVVVSAHKSAFDRLVEKAGLTLDDDATELFAPDRVEAACEAVLATIGNPGTAGNFRRAVAKWRTQHAARVGAAALPDDLPSALDALLGERGVTQSALAQRIGVKPAYVRELALGTMPVSIAGMRIVAAIEKELEQPPGTLAGKVVAPNRRPDMRAASVEYRAVPRKLRTLLPIEAAGWPVDRLADAVAQVAPIMAGSTTYGRLLHYGHRRGERMAAFAPNERLKQERAEFLAYKTAPVSYPYARGRGAMWKTDLSARMGMKELELPFRYAISPVDGGSAAGLGVAAPLQTMAWLAHAPIPLAMFGQRSNRFAEVDTGDGPRGRTYTTAERHLAALLLSMTHPVHGWLTQHPELADGLVPLAARPVPEHADLLRLFGVDGDGSILSAGDVALARSDWPTFVGRAHQTYAQVVEHLDNVLQISRNPFEGISGIAEAAEPQAVLLSCIYSAQAKWSDPKTAPALWRADVRNAAMLRLAAITAFRPSNLLGLTYTGCPRGRIRKVDGVWEIEVPYREFKNFGNAKLFGTVTSPVNYHIQLRDEAGLYQVLDLYFHEVRGGLKGGMATDAAFVTVNGRPMTDRAWYEVVRWFGRRHAAYNPVLCAGVPGVTSINPYSFRHIRASDVLKNGTSANRVEEAAMALQTSETMIRRHYGFMLPREASAAAEDTFGRAARLAWKKKQ